MSPRPHALAILLLCLSALASPWALAAEAKTEYVAATTSDPAIDLQDLDIIAAPLTVDELKVEADSWQALVQKAAEKVAQAKLRIRHQSQKQEAAEDKAENADEKAAAEAEADGSADKGEAPAETATQVKAEAKAEKADEAKDVAMDELTQRRSERNALMERMDIILSRINQKVGLDENGKETADVLAYRRYLDAVGGIKLDVSDAESAIASITGWLTASDGGIRWAKDIASFIAVLFIFMMISGLASRATRKALSISGNQSTLLQDFLIGMARRVVMAIGIIVALSVLGINIGPLLAVIGAAGFIVAFALQDTLGNFASGIMIMLYRPFDVDDVVEVAGISGKVCSLNLVSTTITTFDNKRMVVPNNEIWGNIITNATGSTERRVDMVFGIGYEDDIGQARDVLEAIVAEHSLVLKDPAPVIQLHELADSSVNFICRPWVKTADYWTVYWDVTRSVKERFDAEGISIPFPQRDVHVYQEQAPSAAPAANSGGDQHDTRRGADQMGIEETDNNG